MIEFDNCEETAVVPSSVGVAQLLEEIMPLFKDYFVGEITLSEKGIEYRLENGQSIIILVQAG